MDKESNKSNNGKTQREKKVKKLEKKLEKQQYYMAGNHSAVKICTWTKKSITGKGICYKQKFYGIHSHQCAQMSVSVGFCQNRCVFCWREVDLTIGENMKGIVSDGIDKPDDIIKNTLKGQKILLSGFGGHKDVDLDKFKESDDVKHFAISLTGDALIYPKLNEFIRKLHEQGKTTFVVTNGLLPNRIKSMEPPTQLYISLDAPNEDIFLRIDRPVIKNPWDKLMKTMDILKTLKDKTRTTIRITAIKSATKDDPYGNMVNPEQYADIILRADPKFVEVKGFMLIGSARDRLQLHNMPYHHEVKEFALEIAKHAGLKLIEEKEESRVVLLMKEDSDDRIMDFD